MCYLCKKMGARNIRLSNLFNVSSDLCKLCFMKCIVNGHCGNVTLKTQYWVDNFENEWASAKEITNVD